MSAFIHTNRVINSIAYAMVSYWGGLLADKWNDEDGKPDAGKLADDLYKVNVKSVNYRYSERTSTMYGKYVEPELCSRMQAYMWMRSWCYQSCESRECENTDVYRQVDALIKAFDDEYFEAHGCKPENTAEFEACEWD